MECHLNPLFQKGILLVDGMPKSEDAGELTKEELELFDRNLVLSVKEFAKGTVADENSIRHKSSIFGNGPQLTRLLYYRKDRMLAASVRYKIEQDGRLCGGFREDDVYMGIDKNGFITDLSNDRSLNAGTPGYEPSLKMERIEKKFIDVTDVYQKVLNDIGVEEWHSHQLDKRKKYSAMIVGLKVGNVLPKVVEEAEKLYGMMSEEERGGLLVAIISDAFAELRRSYSK